MVEWRKKGQKGVRTFQENRGVEGEGSLLLVLHRRCVTPSKRRSLIGPTACPVLSIFLLMCYVKSLSSSLCSPGVFNILLYYGCIPWRGRDEGGGGGVRFTTRLCLFAILLLLFNRDTP